MTPTQPTLEAVFTAEVTIGAAIEAGSVGAVRRRIIPILGGMVRGPRLVGEVLTLGADWQVIEDSGAVTHLVARYDRMSVPMKVARPILRDQRGLLAWGEPFLSAGDEPWMSIAKFTLGWM